MKTTPKLSDSVKAVLTGRFIAIQAYLRKQEKNQINNLTFHLKQLEKEEMKNTRVSRKKEIIKIRAEINEKETKEVLAKKNKTKSWFFEKINRQASSQTHQEKKGESNYQNWKQKWRNHNRQYGNTENIKRLPSATI